MNDLNRNKIDGFLGNLASALGGSGGQSESVIKEVQADLESHIQRYQDEGKPEDEAVDLALQQMGNPFELAHHVRREIPPFGGKAVTGIRYLAASGVILWTLMFLWLMRPGSYGFDPLIYAIVVLLHLPAILLLWPRIVWRKNWLFGLIPAGLMLMVILVFSVAGVEGSSEMSIPLTEQGQQPTVQIPVNEPVNSSPDRTMGILVASALGLIAVVFLLSMQRRSQRRVALVTLLIGIAGIEAIFQVEEAMFRNDREKIRRYRDDYFGEHGLYPDKDLIKSPDLRGVRHRGNEEGFPMMWSRPLSSGHAIMYDSNDHRIWVQD